jgi:DNA-directed RNA polymerase specialized sigma24 family protein
MQSDATVTDWIEAVKQGDSLAANRLWERYFDRLVAFAHKKLGSAPRRVADEEDIALSAFKSLCLGAQGGRFRKLDDRHDLWMLLVLIAARKVADEFERNRRLKRRGSPLDEAALGVADASGHGRTLEQIAGSDPSPEFLALVSDECRQRIESLPDESLRRVALLRMEGYTQDEVAAELACTRRTVARKLDVIRKLWLDE